MESLSLSARRAWIEISSCPDVRLTKYVALRKESVDRNCVFCVYSAGAVLSLSARRAWIEIAVACCAPLWMPSLSARRAWIEIRTKGGKVKIESVALRKESVDRNKLKEVK